MNRATDRLYAYSVVLASVILILVCRSSELRGASMKISNDSLEYVDYQLLLRLITPADSIYVDSVFQPFGCHLISYQPDSLWILAEFDPAFGSVRAALDSILQCNLVSAAMPNFILQFAGLPNDPHFTKQYSLHNTGQSLEQGIDGGKPGADINALEAWRIQRGSPAVKVGVLDSGLPMAGCELPCCMSGYLAWEDLDDSNTIVLGSNYIEGQQGCLPHDLTDGSVGHGTAVLSALKSEINNSFGIAGVADSTLTYIVKPLYSGNYVPAAIQEVIQFGVDIVNASWGYQMSGDPLSYDLDTNRLHFYEHYVAEPLYNANILLVACAGNNIGATPDDRTVWFPGAFSQYGTNDGFESGYSNIMNVSGTDRWDSLFSQTNIKNSKSNKTYRTWVSAPAESLFLARNYYIDSSTGYPVTVLNYFSGTSFATPITSGLAALILAQDSTLAPDTVRQIIAMTADKVWQDTSDLNIYVTPPDTSVWWAEDYWQWHPEYGFGRINCYEALRYLIWEDVASILPQRTTIWAEDTTIVLHGDIVINPGCTLVVDQGAVIRGSSYDVTASGHADWLSEVIVAGGVLDINGTSNKSVFFIGKIDRPGQWYGIKVDSGTFTYDYLNMTNEFYDFRWDDTLDSNTTWSGTVTLRGDIVIPSGVTLTIEDSTTIQIENYDLSLYKGVDSSLIEIVVDGGTLRVNGTSSNPVLFTYTDSLGTGKRVDWYGIRIKAGKCIMDHAEVRNAYAGIRMYDSTADTVTNSYFVDCGMYGLRIESDNALIQNSRISGVDPGYGIYVYQANPLIVSDSIWACETGIYSSFGSDLTIDNVKIIGPGKYGAHFCSAGDTLTTVTVDDLSVLGQIEYAHLTLGSNGYFDVSYAILVSDTVVNDTIDRTLSIVNAGLPTKFKLRHSNLAEYGDQAFGIAYCDGRKWDLGTGSTNRGYNNISSSDTGAAYFNYSGEISGGNLMARYNWWGASPPSAYKFATSGSYSVDYSNYARAPYSKLALEERAEVSPVLPSSFSLDQNHPNPFNPSTMISYAIPVKGHVQLSIYNILGQKVRLLVDQEQQPGFHQSLWDGRDQTGREVASGIYLYRLDVANLFQQTKKMIMMK